MIKRIIIVLVIASAVVFIPYAIGGPVESSLPHIISKWLDGFVVCIIGAVLIYILSLIGISIVDYIKNG